jgi:hypothetical protein
MITTREVRETVQSLPNIIKYYKENIIKPTETNKLYEREYMERMTRVASELKPMIEKATESIIIEKDNNRGRPSKLNPK